MFSNSAERPFCRCLFANRVESSHLPKLILRRMHCNIKHITASAPRQVQCHCCTCLSARVALFHSRTVQPFFGESSNSSSKPVRNVGVFRGAIASAPPFGILGKIRPFIALDNIKVPDITGNMRPPPAPPLLSPVHTERVTSRVDATTFGILASNVCIFIQLSITSTRSVWTGLYRS